jgi:hypothetical protein
MSDAAHVDLGRRAIYLRRRARKLGRRAQQRVPSRVKYTIRP